MFYIEIKERNIPSHILSLNNVGRKINEGSHRKRKKIINKTEHTFLSMREELCDKETSGHLLARKTFNSFNVKKNFAS